MNRIRLELEIIIVPVIIVVPVFVIVFPGIFIIKDHFFTSRLA
ncbi:MAG: hypothetical protein ACFFCT_05890 [Candidatus Odinarchaeota archaeon]|nr:hypothetical protein [Candidatus Thorarchaeota archaeon]